MAERLAALGLKPPTKANGGAQQKQEIENKDRQDRLQDAVEEDSRRENDRQRRLAEEQTPVPEPSRAKKPPPAPPVRKSRADSGAQRGVNKTFEGSTQMARAEHEGMEKAIKDQQETQASETKVME